MSGKKRKNRNENANGVTALDLAAAEEAEAVSRLEGNSHDEASINRIFVYFKTHLLVTGIIAFLALGALGAGLKYLDESAQREIADRANGKNGMNSRQEQSFLNKINPFLPAPDPTPTPQLSKEYIYAGSRLLAIEDAGATAAVPADLAVWRPDTTGGTGTWWVMGSAGGSQQVTVQWGANTDKPVPGDYDGDGKTDFSVYREGSGGNPSTWWVMRSSDNTYYSNSFGDLNDKVAPADYDGDGKTDPALWRPSTGVWYILQSSTGQISQGVFGQTGDAPAPADYDGDGRADIAVWRGSQNAFYSVNSSNNQVQTPTFHSSQTGDRVVSADYDGDGRADHAIFDSSTAYWYIFQSSNSQVAALQLGASGSEPVQNDYDGDGKCDVAAWKAGQWTIRNSSNPSPSRTATWGQALDIPVPAFYKR